MIFALNPAATSGALVSAERFSVAPMVGHTHRHTRYFLRLLSRHSWLYTEMLHAAAAWQRSAAASMRTIPEHHPPPATTARGARSAPHSPPTSIHSSLPS